MLFPSGIVVLKWTLYFHPVDDQNTPITETISPDEGLLVENCGGCPGTDSGYVDIDTKNADNFFPVPHGRKRQSPGYNILDMCRVVMPEIINDENYNIR